MAVVEDRLDAARVELAAYLGDPAARALALEEVVARVAREGVDGALRVVRDEPDLRVGEVLAWIDALRLWDRAAVERGLVEATRHLAGRLGAQGLSASEPAPAHERDRGLELTRAALQAVERCLEPGATGDAPALRDGAARATAWSFAFPLVVAATTAARVVLARLTPDHDPAGAPHDALLAWRDVVRRSLPEPVGLRDAVRDALVPWALRAPGEGA